MSNQATLQDIARRPAPPAEQDFKVDLFSAQGFALTQRIAQAYMTSNAVPAPFRAVTTKREKDKNGYYTEIDVPNPAAIGNCIVAIETARAIGMSITAVMQNANIIEGRLCWSGKFVIAAINASGRFTPLRFRVENKGKIKAKYKEKGAWNPEKRGFDFVEREVEVENLVYTAYAYAMENGKRTDELIEGPPVSMKMVVEEGWYAKPGSKWQGDMKHLMFMYRAGAFFGNIHAPDIIMGMGGMTAEEREDIIDVTPQPDGTYAAPVDALKERPAPARPKAKPEAETVDVREAPSPEPAPSQAAEPASREPGEDDDTPDQVLADALAAVRSGDYDIAKDLARSLPESMQREVAQAIDTAEGAKAQPAPTPQRRQRSFNV